jgi:hypothetical protein
MDARRFMTSTWLTNALLDERTDGTYVGTVSDAREQRVRNPYRFERDEAGKRQAVYEPRLVVAFADGIQWVPNQSCLRSLVAAYGPDTSDWVGQKVSVSRRERVNRTTGEITRERVVVATDLPAGDQRPGQVVPMHREVADYDDSSATVDSASDAVTADEIFGKRRAW